MSAVIPRLPCTISLIRRGGTPIDTASLFYATPKPAMKSSIGPAPVIVDDFHQVPARSNLW